MRASSSSGWLNPPTIEGVNFTLDAYITVGRGDGLLPRHQTSTFLPCDVDPRATDLRLLIDYHHSYSQTCTTANTPIGEPPVPGIQDYWQSALDRRRPPLPG